MADTLEIDKVLCEVNGPPEMIYATRGKSWLEDATVTVDVDFDDLIESAEKARRHLLNVRDFLDRLQPNPR